MKIRAIPARKPRSLLLKIGFEEEAGKDHVFFYFRYVGRIVVRAKISHGAKEIDQPVLGLMGKQLKLKRKNFEEFLRGELSREDYIGILRELEVI
ncbi:MAG: hypothetical protein U9M97_03090 [Candidatus Hadarchaeota archaeon]|nr:hypothetical protein [Candidatus Hadarchaeota archaeon]